MNYTKFLNSDRVVIKTLEGFVPNIIAGAVVHTDNYDYEIEGFDYTLDLNIAICNILTVYLKEI